MHNGTTLRRREPGAATVAVAQDLLITGIRQVATVRTMTNVCSEPATFPINPRQTFVTSGAIGR
ncbi:hypothetical protein V1281_002750 [Nitrobacteraceae bacterium AZCC 2161]|jgi:hypothetical protein